MHHETEDAHASNGHEAVAKVSSAAEDRRMIAGEDDMRILNDAVSKVSPHAVKDLLSLGGLLDDPFDCGENVGNVMKSLHPWQITSTIHQRLEIPFLCRVSWQPNKAFHLDLRKEQ
ncbi:hypothetical protein CK203_005624 [Vitis vinifera]|uniref:Uncharacterized protein n=1 Tax=Vitis vinifera TaxID=29760 RepID=A0A438K3S5_VITVI|nr:hypothetical protein CK203_005624 [Vitis vinifera]